MEGLVQNLISNPKEGSDSNSSSNLCRLNKRHRDDNPSSSVRFKGVVLQQNGHWGAQIYANQQRIWLGTFKSEQAAAMAYDSAAIKLRSGDSYRNFPWSNITIQEPNFQDHHTREVVLNMIKEGSYEAKFADYVRSQSSNIAKEALFDLPSGCVDGGSPINNSFKKELTPSDVGKLNRLVIPKKHATKYFPQVSEESTVGEDGTEGFQLVFFDRRLRSWKFRYCYWKSSQSYVFTRGWNRFVKEKELKAKDLVTFYKCDCVEGFMEEKSFCMIDVSYNGGESEGPCVVEGFGDWGGKGKVQLKLELGLHFDLNYDKEGGDEEVVMEPVGKKAVKLFGVEIG